MSAVVVRTNGQVLVVFSVSGASLYASQANADAATSALTFPATITTDTTYYVPDATQVTVTLTVRQQDGSVLFNTPFLAGNGMGTRYLSPLPTAEQVAADAAGNPGRTILQAASYYWCQHVASVSNGTMTAGVLQLTPMRLDEPQVITEIGVYISTGGGTGAVMRFGAYAGDGSGGIGSLIADMGTVACETSTAMAKLTALTTELPAGVVWLAAVPQVGTAPSVERISAWQPPVPIPYRTTEPAAAALYQCVISSSVTGALAASVASPAASANFPARLWVKTAA